MFSVRTSASKCVTEPAFDTGRAAASPSAKTFGRAEDWRVAASVGTNPERVSQPFRPGDVRRTPVDRNRHEEVELDAALVPAHGLPLRSVDLAGRELGDEADPSRRGSPARCSEATGFVTPHRGGSRT